MKKLFTFFWAAAQMFAQSPQPAPAVLGAQMIGGQPVTGSPYSAQASIDMTQALADGNRIERHSGSMRYRDTQGRERREEALFGGNGAPAVFISDPAARTSYTLDEKSRTAQKTGPLPPAPPPAPLHGSSLGIVYRPSANQSQLLEARGLDHGAYVEERVNGSPAEAAGIRSGDILLTLDGQSIRDSEDFRSRILAIPAGAPIAITLDRGGEKIDIHAITQDRSQVFKNLPSALGGQSAILPMFFLGSGVEQSLAVTEDLGAKSIEGLRVEGKRSTATIPAGKIGNQQPIRIVSESWYSPDLQTMILVKHSDPRTGDTVYRLTHIDRTEPPASLFQVPPGYTSTQAVAPAMPTRVPIR